MSVLAPLVNGLLELFVSIRGESRYCSLDQETCFDDEACTDLLKVCQAFQHIVPVLTVHEVTEDPEEDNSGPIKFAFMWPMIALEVVYRIVVGENNND